MERNRDAEGLQVAPSQEKQTYYNTEPPEVHDYSEYRAQLRPYQLQTPTKICGLRRTTFWLLLVIALLVIGGALGGGIAGGLSARDNSEPEDVAVSVSSEVPQSSSTGSPTTTTAISSTATATQTSSTPVTSGRTGLSENPCPDVNGTILESSARTSFAVLCSVDWPRGTDGADGDGEVSDISRTTVYTLQDCIDACVEFDRDDCKAVTYEANLTASFGGGQGGNCFFKDRAGTYFPGRDTTISAGIIGG